MSEKNQTIMMITFWCITNIVMWGRFVYLLIVKRRKEAKEFLLACLAMLTPFGGPNKVAWYNENQLEKYGWWQQFKKWLNQNDEL